MRRLIDRVPSIDEGRLLFKGGSSSVGRASAFQAEGRGFDPRFPLHYDKVLLLVSFHHSASLSISIDGYFFLFGPRSSVGGALPW